jgi:hypothetical protein
MRFKPRTDLERIADAVKEHHYGNVNEKIVKQQLKKLKLNTAKRKKKIDYDYNKKSNQKNNISIISDSSSENAEEEKKEDIALREKKLKKQEERKYYKRVIDNSKARDLIEGFHNKTHFKGAAIYAMFKGIFITKMLKALSLMKV